jgi:hypothetical protein
MKMLEVLIAQGGIEIDDLKIVAKGLRAWRLRGARTMDLHLVRGAIDEHLLCLASYEGTGLHYRPWIELYCINPGASLAEGYYDTQLEEALLSILSEALGPGGRIFVEYYADLETSSGLALGFPPAATRQGYRLFNIGFTWFKDWYFSEGGYEGGQKLQGEKPMDEVARKRHLRRIRAEVAAFLEEWREGGEHLTRARVRGRDILLKIDELLGDEEEQKPKKGGPDSNNTIPRRCNA